jgi:hypothetical protein
LFRFVQGLADMPVACGPSADGRDVPADRLSSTCHDDPHMAIAAVKVIIAADKADLDAQLALSR